MTDIVLPGTMDSTIHMEMQNAEHDDKLHVA